MFSILLVFHSDTMV